MINKKLGQIYSPHLKYFLCPCRTSTSINSPHFNSDNLRCLSSLLPSISLINKSHSRSFSDEKQAKPSNFNLNEPDEASQIPAEFMPEKVVDKIYQVRDLDLPKDIVVKPITSLGIKEQIIRVKKTGSFVKHLFIGRFDTDFLAYPEILKTRREFDRVIEQCEMVEKNFHHLLPSPKALKELGFYNLYRWTASEMMTVLESIGHSMVIKPSDYNYTESLNKEQRRLLGSKAVFELIKHQSIPVKNRHLLFDLINQNCLGWSAIEWSDNENLRGKLLAEHIDNPDLKIGWAWCERDIPFGSGDFVDWKSTASVSKDRTMWVVNGEKNRILKGDYDYYAIFCQTYDYDEDEDPDWLLREKDIPPGIVGFLVPKHRLGIIEDDEVVNGLVFQKIKFDYLNLPSNDHLLIDPSPLGVRSQNIQGLGYLGVSAFILGFLKALLKDTYTYLTRERTPLLECQTTERILGLVTAKIYSLESCLYLTSQAHDSFDNVNADPEIFLESAICKILATETAHDVTRMLQSIYGSQMLITSPIIDLINMFDSYLNNTVYHRVSVGKMGTWMAGYYKNDHIRKLRLAPFFPAYKIGNLLQGESLLGAILPLDVLNLKGHLHPSFEKEALNLETSVHNFGLGVEMVLHRWAKKTTRKQNDLERLSQMAIDLYTLTCTLSRASKAYCDHGRNSEIDRLMTIDITNELYVRLNTLFKQVNESNDDFMEYRTYYVNKKNMEFGGYFAQSGLHKIRY